jgi:chitodextrinase
MESGAMGFAEEAIRAVGRLDVSLARTSVSQAFEVDHEIGPLADAVYLACAEIEEENVVSTATWNTLADAVDSAELLAVVEGTRTH